MTKVSCVVPAYNEAESLPHLWDKLRSVLDRFSAWEFVVVSDGSTDQTVSIVSNWARNDSRIRLVALRRNQGKSAALMAGFEAASGDVVVTLDADLQDDPEEIPRLVERLESQDLDLVGGWKQNRQDPFVKLVSSKVFNWLASRVAKQRFHDLNCGLKAYRAEVAKGLDLYGDLYRFIPILAVAGGWRVGELPVKHHPRKYGVSKYGLRLGGVYDLLTLALITNYRWRPLHFFGRWGLAFLLVGIGILVYLLWIQLQGARIGDRPLLIFGVLCVIAGLQLFFTGLLGDLILQHQRRR